jgi:rhodanese-related sulfurtransferase
MATPLRAQGLKWSLVNWKIHRDFPDVPRIAASQVDHWLRDPHRSKPVLLDVRTLTEYEVSHIPGAQRVDPDANVKAITTPKDKPIVTYCSVGYRSAALARKLREAGFTNVQNMSGSIFDWANQGYPLEQNGQPAHKVHPYNAVWGTLLKKELRADVPAAGLRR